MPPDRLAPQHTETGKGKLSDEINCPSFDAVFAAPHPSPDEGGPCATCAFRPGSKASGTDHTVMLAKLCIEGGRTFKCHERAGLCRGYIASVNLRGAKPFDDRATLLADYLAEAIGAAARGELVAPHPPSSDPK